MRSPNRVPVTDPRPISVVMLILATLQLAISGLAALVGLFADGGDIWQRVLLVGVHPLSAVGLLIAVVLPGLGPRALALVLLLLLIRIGGDAVVSALIAGGAIKGDWWLPLIFSAVPIAGTAYLSGRLLSVCSSTRNS